MDLRRLLKTLPFCLLAVCATWAVAAAAVTYGAQYVAVEAQDPPPLDASFSAPVWQSAIKASGFWDFTTREPARLPTTAYLLYDKKNLYVGFDVGQKGVPITATQTVNDVGYGLDDAVTFAVDTSDNNSRAYSFTVTPGGVRYETSSESSRYQPPWRAVTKRTADGYTAVMIIPLSDLRTQNAAVQSWRIDFTRHIAAKGDLYTWAYVPGSDAYCNNNQYSSLVYCDSTKWPHVTGLQVKQEAAARPRPYADIYALSSSGSDRTIFQTTPGNLTSERPRSLGLDVAYPFTSTMSFVGTLAPDFSSVEEDQTTIVPQEFSRHFQEYRPFFAEGFGYIDDLPHINVNGTGSTIFYTPSIGIVNSGYKVEGTSGRNSIGALSVTGPGYDDQAFGLSNARADGSFSVSTEGVLAHHPGITDDTVGAGITYQNLHSGFQPLALFEQERGTLIDAPGQGNRFVTGAVLQHGSLLAGAIFEQVGAEFAPVDGYTPVNDIRGPQLLLQYNGVASARSFVKSYGLGAVADRFVDGSGAVHQADIGGSASVTFKDLLSVSLGGGASELRAYTDPYPVYQGGRTFPFNQDSISLGYKDGTANPIDFSYSYGPFAIYCPGLQPQPEVCGSVSNNFSPAYVHQVDVSTTRTLGRVYSVSFEYGGTLAHGYPLPLDSQWLRRVSVSRAFGKDAELAIGLRSINGTGGFALPGTNLALSYHERFTNADQLYIEYGTPASRYTLHRFIIKYVFHTGGAAGT
jgi:hypothetical protein